MTMIVPDSTYIFVVCYFFKKKNMLIVSHFVHIYRWLKVKKQRKSVSSDIQTLRRGLKKRGAAEFF
jgi:uncharacterized protein HemY